MATTKIRQRPDKKSRDGKLALYVQVCIEGKVKLYPTGQSVEAKYWDDKNQRVKKIPGSHNQTQMNLILEKKHQEIKDILFQQSIEGRKTTFESITSALEPKEEISTKFIPLFTRFMNSKSSEYTAGSIRNYKVLFNQILEFKKSKDFEVEEIDFGFYDRFKNWLLRDKGHKNDTVNKRLKTLKTFLRYCSNHDLYDLSILNKMKMLESKPTTKIALTEKELDLLWKHDFSGNKRLERVRDLFVFACVTGLRESDIQNLKKANIRNGNIYVNTIKTSEELEIPLNQYSRSILEKYDYNLPKISQQKLNNYLKEVGKAAGLTNEEVIVSFQGGKRREEIVPRYSLLVSHVGRRSFVTLNIYKGIPIPVIQSMTGHKDLASFQKYIKIDKSAKERAMERW